MTKEREFDELVWVAFQFANGELDAATSANFESSLESDQMAQRALVAAVELVEVLDGIDLAGQLTKDPQAEIARLSKSHRGPEVAAIDPQAVSLAIGDGANDIPMLEAATYGFAYHAKPKARASADGVIDDGDLATVLSLLGISEIDWVKA